MTDGPELAAPPGRLAAAAWVIAIVPPILLALHATAIVPLAWSSTPIAAIQPVSGFSYGVPLQTGWMSRQWVGDSPAQVFEDGRLLSCANAPAADTTNVGRGRYQIEGGWVYFSSSDNTDPRRNGRRYEMRWPTPPGWPATVVLLAVSMSSGLFAVWLSRAALGRLLQSPPLWLCVVVVLAPLAAHRYWYFADVPIPAVHPDSGSYYVLASQIMSGEWPRFEIRPPAYPLFLATVLPVMRSLYGMIVLQTIMTAASACLLVYAVYRLHRGLALGAALAMAGFVTGIWAVEHDTAVLSENLYVNSIVSGIAFIILGLATSRAWPLAMASAAFGLTIITRPAGLFLFGPYVLVAAFLWCSGHARRMIAAMLVPMPLVLLAVSTYNLVTAGVFNVTAWGEANLAVATFTMWREDPTYPANVNAKVSEIRQMIDARLSDSDRDALAHSWDPDRLAAAFLKGFWGPALTAASEMGTDYLDSRRWIRRVAIDSVRKSPQTYTKFVSSMAYVFYVGNVRFRADFSELMTNRVLSFFPPPGVTPPGDPVRAELLRTYYHRQLPASVHIGGECWPDGTVAFAPTPGRRVQTLVRQLRDALFARALWPALALIVVVLASIRLVLARGQHLGSFILLLLGVTTLGAGAIVCLVEYGGVRYAYPTEFTYALTVFLAPLLWWPRPGVPPAAPGAHA